MEGVTSYLKEEEIAGALEGISRMTSATSTLVTTWIGKSQPFPGRVSIHVSRTDSPEQYFEDKVWRPCGAKKSIGELAQENWTFDNISPDDRSYFITCHERR